MSQSAARRAHHRWVIALRTYIVYIHLAGLRITWDDRKRAANLHKHGIDLVDAAAVFGGAILTVPDVRHDDPFDLGTKGLDA